MTIKIDKNIPLPPASGGPHNRKYPFDELSVGDSFFIPGKKTVNVAGSMTTARKRTGFVFSARAVTEDGVSGVRVWRIK